MGISLHILPTTNAPTFPGASPDISESITTHSCICIREDILHNIIHKCSLHLTTHTTLHMASPHVLQPYLTTSHHTPIPQSHLSDFTSPHCTTHSVKYEKYNSHILYFINRLCYIIQIGLPSGRCGQGIQEPTPYSKHLTNRQ